MCNIDSQSGDSDFHSCARNIDMINVDLESAWAQSNVQNEWWKINPSVPRNYDVRKCHTIQLQHNTVTV